MDSYNQYKFKSELLKNYGIIFQIPLGSQILEILTKGFYWQVILRIVFLLSFGLAVFGFILVLRSIELMEEVDDAHRFASNNKIPKHL